MHTHISQRSEFEILENEIANDELFNDKLTNRLSWSLAIEPLDDTNYNFKILGTYRIFEEEKDAEDFLKISAGYVFTVSELDPKNVAMDILQSCFDETYDKLKDYIGTQIKKSRAQIFTFPYTDPEVVRSHIHIHTGQL